MTVKCSHCGALHWAVERSNSLLCRLSIDPTLPSYSVFESCCKKGTVKLDAFHEPPSELQDLLLDDSPRGKAFREHIRQYNSALTFTSLGYKKDDRPENQQGRGPFQIHGELYHLVGKEEEELRQRARLLGPDVGVTGHLARVPRSGAGVAVTEVAAEQEAQEDHCIRGRVERGVRSEEIQSKMDRSRSTLMAFFDYNAKHPDGRHLLYQEFPEHYVFD